MWVFMGSVAINQGTPCYVGAQALLQMPWQASEEVDGLHPPHLVFIQKSFDSTNILGENFFSLTYFSPICQCIQAPIAQASVVEHTMLNKMVFPANCPTTLPCSQSGVSQLLMQTHGQARISKVRTKIIWEFPKIGDPNIVP